MTFSSLSTVFSDRQDFILFYIGHPLRNSVYNHKETNNYNEIKIRTNGDFYC